MSVMLEALRKAEGRARMAATGASAAASGLEPGSASCAAPATSGAAELREYLRPLGDESERAPADVHGVSTPAELTLEPAPGAPSLEPAAVRSAHAAAASGPTEMRRGAVAGPIGPGMRWPLVLVSGLLSVVTAGAIAYFWIQLEPRTPVAAGTAARPIGAGTGMAADPPSAQVAIPGLPAAAPVLTAEAEAVPPSALPSPAARKQAPQAQALATESAASRDVPARETQNRGEAMRIHVQVQSGYAAFQAGQLGAARAAYEQALRDEPGNRDATLGMAALEIHARRFDLAEARYLSLLQAAPRDPDALAGLLALRAERVDPLHAESSLRTLLASDPDSAALHFALGNQLARQERWAEAQGAYSRALAEDAGNPDAAFNLAVSLDRLHQPAEAVQQYEFALRLAEKRVASFSPEVARLRLLQLAP